MAKIKVLDKHMAELIAAGEVIDRPCSVIKELMENSMDAGATAITVEIQRGGISYMRVTDDGCGISPEDIRTAFVRHATSKLETEEDLNSIATFGFRGEALASVAVMSKTEVLTRTADSSTGTRYRIEGGEECELESVGCPQGTTIIVRDLFYNTPARMKFLKKDVAEGNAVAGVVDRLALANPHISVKFIRDGKICLHTPGNGDLYAAIYAVFGRDYAKNLIKVEYTFQNVSVSGYLVQPEFARASRQMQHVYINSRYVKAKTVTAALEEACKGSIMVGKFPACVLNLSVPYETVDVNVHPAKIEVRFLNERIIFDSVYAAIKSALESDRAHKEVQLPPQSEQLNPFTLKVPEEAVQQRFPSSGVTLHHADVASYLRKDSDPVLKPDFGASHFPISETHQEALPKELPTSHIIHTEFPAVSMIDSSAEVLSAPQKEPKILLEPERSEEIATSKIVGEIFGTYIIVQQKDSMLLIDKHAAHERLLYEQLLEQNSNLSRQLLLTPIIITLSKDEYAMVCEQLPLFEKAGFLVEEFGGYSIAVREIPTLLDHTDIEPIIGEMIDCLRQNNRNLSFSYLDWLYHSIACRAAVKARDKSGPEELQYLIERLEENPQLRHCPHGRPIYIQMKQRELEKQFGRIQ